MRWQFDFPKGTPLLLKGMFVLLFTNFVGSYMVTLWAEHYANRQPTPVSPFPIHFRGGLVVYVPTSLGIYEEWSFWMHFVFLVVIAAMFWWYHRIGQAVRIG
jgi:hypothetical protein